MHERIEITAEPEVNIRLTVAIPTFDRNEILKINLAKLIPQLTPVCELVILDNCSPVPVEDTLNDLLASVPENINVRIIRHRANVGGNENILRCFEYANGEFVWLLGDDDEPVDSAVANIFHELDVHPDAVVFNMYAPTTNHAIRTITKVVNGSMGYLSVVSFFGELIFISSLVLKVNKALNCLAAAHLWQSSHAPQLIVVGLMLRPDGVAVISSMNVVHHGGETTPIEKQSSTIPIALGFPTLLLAPWDDVEARRLQWLLKNARKDWITPKGVLNQLVSLANQEQISGRQLALRYYRLLSQNFFAIGHPLSLGRIQFASAWPLLLWPKFGYMVRNAAYRILKRTEYKNLKLNEMDNDKNNYFRW